MTLIVCSLSDMPGVVSRRRASHLVTLLDPGTPAETPLSLAPGRHLRLDVNDINAPADGYILPQADCVLSLLDFARGWDASAPMVIHCFAGVSRSTASAFTVACARNPDASEFEIARTLRRAAPHALPNRRIVALAADILGRGGRMVDAVDAIGANDFGAQGMPFDLPVRYPALA
jgi:predicted protein tyrosine phosphatase